jgi:hypothetical protein
VNPLQTGLRDWARNPKGLTKHCRPIGPERAPLFGSALAVALLISACATPPPPAPKPTVASKPVVDFPSLAALEAIASKPARSPGVSKSQAQTRDWQIDGAHASSSYGELWQPAGSWDNAFSAAVSNSGRDLRLTRAMNCVAREFGRFHLETNSLPSEDVKRFIVGACGGISPRVGLLSLVGEVPPKSTDEVLLTRWRGQLQPELIMGVPSEASEVGFWFGHRGKRAVAIAAYSSLDADMLPFSLVPDAQGEITAEGEAREAADYFVGYVNRGRVGVEACLVDPSLHHPRFRFICRVDPADETAWIDLLYAPPRRALAKPFAHILARRSPGQAISYVAPASAITGPIAREADFAPAVLGELNRIRQQAGLPAVHLAEAQSLTGERLAKHYFTADVANGDRHEADTIALGMIAGWQVQDGVIRGGSFISTTMPESKDAGLWLSIALSLPMARESLLDREVEEVAVGPAVLLEPPGLGAITSGYRFYHGNDHRQDVWRLFQRVLVARKRLSLPPPRRLTDVENGMLEQLARVYEGNAEPMEALDVVLKLGTIGVTHHKPKGAAWGQLVVFVAFIDYGEEPK